MILDRKTDDKHLLNVSRSVSFVCGIAVIAVALFFDSLSELSLFELMMSVSTMVQVPLLVPLIFGLFIKKTPLWAPWVTVIIGLFVSWLMTYVFTPELFAGWMGLEQALTRRESVDATLMLTIAAHLFITAGFFCSTALFYKEENDNHRQERERFFVDIESPVVADSDQDEVDRQQRYKLGAMVLAMGIGVTFMALIPNPVWGRVLFVLCSVAILFIGILLRISARADS